MVMNAMRKNNGFSLQRHKAIAINTEKKRRKSTANQMGLSTYPLMTSIGLHCAKDILGTRNSIEKID